jgi:hypothetical protein
MDTKEDDDKIGAFKKVIMAIRVFLSLIKT